MVTQKVRDYSGIFLFNILCNPDDLFCFIDMASSLHTYRNPTKLLPLRNSGKIFVSSLNTICFIPHVTVPKTSHARMNSHSSLLSTQTHWSDHDASHQRKTEATRQLIGPVGGYHKFVGAHRWVL